MSESLPVVGKIYSGTIRKLEKFGAFVELSGFRTHGLIHVSQLAKDRVEDPSDVVSTNQSVFVKVIQIDNDSDKPRISLSMKYCNQDDGTDKDPHGIDAELMDRKRRPRTSGEQQPLQLEAVLNTVCSKCGGKGHIAMECYNRSGKKYDLISDDEAETSKAFAAVRKTPAHVTQNSSNNRDRRNDQLPAVGRGRGAIMPAWMSMSENTSFGPARASVDARTAEQGVTTGPLLSSSSSSNRRHDAPERGRSRSRSRDKQGSAQYRDRPSRASSRSSSSSSSTTSSARSRPPRQSSTDRHATDKQHSRHRHHSKVEHDKKDLHRHHHHHHRHHHHHHREHSKDRARDKHHHHKHDKHHKHDTRTDDKHNHRDHHHKDDNAHNTDKRIHQLDNSRSGPSRSSRSRSRSRDRYGDRDRDDSSRQRTSNGHDNNSFRSY